MNNFSNAHSFASRKNAVRKLEQVLGDRLDQFEWMVIAQEDGRFSPVVRLRENQRDFMVLAHQGICVIA